MVAMALRVQPKVCAVVASANKSETAARPAAARPVSKSANLAATTAAKTLVATSVAVALASNTMSANAMELLAQTYEAQPVAQLADASKASKAQAIAEALAKEKGIRTPSNEAATSTKALEMPKSIVPDEKVSLGPAAPLLLLFSPLLLVLGDALQKAGKLVAKTFSSLGS
mmetsp:Transcript_5766/g.20978  ORF Transcript_5766/g.20978 Transcript_5766/m.20978 type:complete len:171 (-) Transcript_5766:70-582(-)